LRSEVVAYSRGEEKEERQEEEEEKRGGPFV